MRQIWRKMLAAVSRSLAGGTPTGASFYGRLADCPRKHFHSVVQGLVSINQARPVYFDRGSLFHAAAAAYYEVTRCSGQRPDPNDLRSEFIEASAFIDLDPKEEADVWAAFTRWCLWERDPKVYGSWKPIAVEVPLAASYQVEQTSFGLTAKVDVIMHDSVGTTFAMDHKFTSMERGSVETSYLLSTEIATTLLCARDGIIASGSGWKGMSKGSSFTDKDGISIGSLIPLRYVFVNNVFNRTTPPPGRGASIMMSDEVLDGFVQSIARSLAIDIGDQDDIRTWMQRGLLNGACRDHGRGRCVFMDLCSEPTRGGGLYQ